MRIFRSDRQAVAQMGARIIHGEHHQLHHANKARRLAARDRVRDQDAETRFQLTIAQTIWGPMRCGVEV